MPRLAGGIYQYDANDEQMSVWEKRKATSAGHGVKNFESEIQLASYMRAIKIDLPATLRLRDPNGDITSDEVRSQVYAHLKASEYELCELIRQRTKEYVPVHYSVFVSLLPKPEGLGLTTEIWVIDPNISWGSALFARRAWQVLIPVLVRTADSVFVEREKQIGVDIDASKADVTVCTPTRGWRDPVILSAGWLLATSAYWIFFHTNIATTFRHWLGN